MTTIKKAPAFETAKGFTKRTEGIKREWVVEDMVTRGGAHVWAGAKGLGKSVALLDMAYAVATGADWLGHKTVRGDVLYIDTEDDEVELRDRYQRLVGDREQPDNLYFKLAPPTLVDGGAKFIDTWLAEASNPVLVIIDVVVDVHEELMTAGHARSKLAMKQQWWTRATKNNTAIILSAHCYRDANNRRKKGDWRETIVGSLGWTAAAHTTFGIFGDIDTQERVLYYDGKAVRGRQGLTIDRATMTVAPSEAGETADITVERAEFLAFAEKFTDGFTGAQYGSAAGISSAAAGMMASRAWADKQLYKEGRMYYTWSNAPKQPGQLSFVSQNQDVLAPKSGARFVVLPGPSETTRP